MQEDLYEVFASSVEVDQSIFSDAFENLKTENYFDFLSKDDNQRGVNKYYLSNENIQKLNGGSIHFEKITNIIKIIKDHDFSRKIIPLSLTQKLEQIQLKKYQKILRLSNCQNSQFVQLPQIRDLSNIKNTTLIGANLVRCNLSGSEFENVNISGVNLNGAQLFNCKWENLKIDSLHQLTGHKDRINQLCFSPDDNQLAPCSNDDFICLWNVKRGKIRNVLQGKRWIKLICFSNIGTILAFNSYQFINLWNLKTMKQQRILVGRNRCINSVCFCPDGSTLASGGKDNSICLRDVKIGIKNSNQMVILMKFYKFVSLQMVPQQHLGAGITQSVYGKLRQGNKKPDQMVILIMSTQFAFLLMVLHQYLVVMTNLSVYGILKQDNKKQSQMVILIISTQFAFLLMVLHQYLPVRISLFVYGMLKQDIKRQNTKVIVIQSDPFPSLQIVVHQYQVVRINRFVYGMLRQVNKKPNWMVMLILSIHYAFLLVVLHWCLVVMINLSVYGMLNQVNKCYLQVMTKVLQHNFNPEYLLTMYFKKLVLFFTIPQLPQIFLIFQSTGALIFKGEFVNQSAINLRSIFKQKGGIILENQIELQLEQN
ncbi:unnamed protein product [Paramecium octaurelia]|uniref:WD domain, G-beta repeat protein n=1 Tax=Paramecium octaurelia TaxID=43137 RepID=A0A8S1TVQ4_PAROT|nr:unnamed protein product [Paramecium octaurelia]